MTQFDSGHPDMNRLTLTTKPEGEYALLDSGMEEKLERYGGIVLARPDPQALWPKRLATSQWESANGRYERQGGGGKWHADNLPKEWEITFEGLRFAIKPTSFKHTGLFPEQAPNWSWIAQKIIPGAKVLNLFGYTGGASLAAAKAGAEVTHVDASKTAVSWARENAALSELEDKPIRWIVEDALTYLQREVKRGNKYDAIVMDPPAFGHGPKDELWKFEEHFLELMQLCQELLSDKPLFVLINGYAAGYSPLAFAYNLEPLVKKFGGSIEYGDLTIEESSPSTTLGTARMLPCGIFARWSK
jgi:23S rRNA (cytosine1962-C5)-methyltransferase